MSNIFTPTNQKPLTNVAVVRLSKNGKRFEIACYKNKVINWRDGTETDINEVLQIQEVFTNVSKGATANKDLITKCFGTSDVTEVCKLILKSGDLQWSEKERKELQDNLFKEIANIVADKCIDPETGVAHQSTLIQNAMKELHFSVKPNQGAKKQALELIPKLSTVISIKRANMRVKVCFPSKEGKKLKPKILELMTVESEDHGMDTTMVGVVSPGHVKIITELVQDATKGKGSVEVLSLKDVVDGDAIV
ncbi:ribosome maturation protein SBDS [Hyalella azteca]|uniref:Ribosome maturation protein SBDS n=1 Tax=Hyalella azteca TaxID=294128 RepID=A0A8B7NTK0_HYAAZ|nr:ribosome maturation protein SBDS [Hyalella azteca]